VSSHSFKWQAIAICEPCNGGIVRHRKLLHITILNCVLAIVFLSADAVAQDTQLPSSEAELTKMVIAMQAQIKELQSAVAELKAQAGNRHQEPAVPTVGYSTLATGPSSTPPARMVAVNDHANAAPADAKSIPLDEQLQLLSGEIKDQYQTKVESGSKYRVKLSGLILMNLFENRGTVDAIDNPGIAEPQGPLAGRGAFGGSLRQSQVGIDLYGPTWAGAKVGADLRFDFAGGFPDEGNGVTLGLMRLRTGTIRLAWPNITIVAGQDAPFFSALSPTSIASVAEPTFASSGNLWSWMPQIRVEKRMHMSSGHSLLIQAGILDPLTGDLPQGQFERQPQAGEASRQPAYATRFAWASGEGENAATVGAGAYYSRQNWAFGRNVDGWAGTADWQLPIARRFALSGEFYRGRAIGGLGAATYNSVLSTGVLNDSQAHVQGLDVVGGWVQLKLRATPTLQFNAAYGQDDPFAGELRAFRAAQNFLDPQLGRNQGAMFNFIYRPRSNLLFSTEYRHLDSVRLNQDRFSAEHLNMSIGVLF
jgi:hypothetical protein